MSNSIRTRLSRIVCDLDVKMCMAGGRRLVACLLLCCKRNHLVHKRFAGKGKNGLVDNMMKDLLFRKVSAASQHQPLFAALRLPKNIHCNLVSFSSERESITTRIVF